MNNSTVIGIDLVKSVFQVGVMTDGKLTSNKQVKRARLHSMHGIGVINVQTMPCVVRRHA